jgi:uncharacterized membrane protein
MNIYLLINPGAFLDSVKPFAYVSKMVDQDVMGMLVDAVAVSDERTYQQDPRYGFIVLCEIALRALSPAVNDPGTAIDVLGTYVRLARQWVDESNATPEQEVKFVRVYILPISEADLLEDMYSPMLVEASKHVSVTTRLRKSLESIKKMPNSPFTEHIGKIEDRLTKLESANLI